MNKLVQNFVHRPGVHCESTALRNIYEFYGFNFSEPMIFGLGSGLGFIYWKMKRMKFPFIGGRGRDLDKNLCANLGVGLETRQTSSRRKAYQTLTEMLGSGVPAAIRVDMPYLKYLNLSPEAHFGAHTVVVAGLDEQRGVAYLADTQYEKLQIATLGELEEARASRFGPFPAKNSWFEFKFPAELTPLDKAIKRAIAKTVDSMLNPPIRNMGVKGIRHFGSEIVKWLEEYPPQEFGWGYKFTYVYLEEDGTGGGCFRYLFARFLREAGEFINSDGLKSSGDRYEQVGKRWTEVAYLVRDIPNGARVGDIQKLLFEIADEEQEILSALKKFG